jgi:hypothetical protein
MSFRRWSRERDAESGCGCLVCLAVVLAATAAAFAGYWLIGAMVAP